jgi:hypothetical protein
MVAKTRNDRRLLSKSERDLVDQTRQPAIKELSDMELVNLLKSLRRYCARALATSKFSQRNLPRRVRKQSFAVTPHNGARRSKSMLLKAAVERANKEIQRRFVASARNKRQARAW